MTKMGKICCNKWEISQEFLPHSKREEYSGIFGFTDNVAVVAYLLKKRTV
jgi:deferrochelatase/peroxidase EfeB